MAFDGFAIFNIINEIKENVLGGRIDKIHQPEKDEITLTVRNNRKNHKILLTANSVYPRIHITNIDKENPLTAPLFTMVLRKHIGGGKITNITSPNFDRIVNIFIESRDELGDITEKQLIIEIMGRHSNIILIDNKKKVLDSIKRIGIEKSSVRPILPNTIYSLPPDNKRVDPNKTDFNLFYDIVKNNTDKSIDSIIYQNHFGISPVIAKEICFRSGVSHNEKNISKEDAELVYNSFEKFFMPSLFVNQIISCKERNFFDFSFIELTMYDNCNVTTFNSPSQTIEEYYKERDSIFRIKQKTTDLRKLIENNIDRCEKKSAVYDDTLNRIENREDLRLKGELITANIYNINKGDEKLITQNFYDEDLTNISINLDTELSPAENAQKYFKKYNKQKRTFDALHDQINENIEELSYLKTILSSLYTSESEGDIDEIRNELYNQNYLKKKQKSNTKSRVKKSKPMKFISSDGFLIYVGKNNTQNDELTLKFASNNDIWLHTKDIPGSHVIIKIENKEVTEETILEASHIAAYYSNGREGSNVPVDYVTKKNVKKPNGAKPGMVIYNNNKTMYVTPDKKVVESLEYKNS